MYRILVAEDNENNQVLIQDIFRKKRGVYDLSFASDGPSTLTKVEELSPDLLLLDMRLPEISGWEVASLLKKKQAPPPIIAVTAHAMKGDKEKALESGCDDFITKPIDKKVLLEKVAFWLGVSQE